MHRADTTGAVAGLFVDDDAASGVRGADLDAAAANDWQENICAFIEREGTGLVKGRKQDLLDALDHAYGVKPVEGFELDGATVQVVNTTTPGEIVRFTVPADTLAPGRRLRVRAIGERTSGAAVSFAVRFGSPSSAPVALANAGAGEAGTTGWRLDVEISATEFTGQVVVLARLKIEGTNTYSEIEAAYAADLTDDLDVIVTAAMATASPSVWTKRRHYSAELI